MFQSSFWFFITFLYKLSFAVGHSFAKDFCPCLLLFICEGLLSILILSYSFGFCYMFTKDRGRCLPVYLQRTAALFLVLFTKDAVLILCYSFAKDHGPCVVVFILKGPLSLSLPFICKRPLSLSGAIYLQRTVVLV